MRPRKRFIPHAVLVALALGSAPVQSAILPPGPAFYINFRGTTNTPLTLTIEVMTTPMAGGVPAPTAGSPYVIPIAIGTPPDLHGGAVIAAIGADPALTIGPLIEVRPGWWRAPIEGAAGLRVGIRAFSSTIMPPPPMPPYDLAILGPWPAQPVGIQAFDTRSYGTDGDIFVPGIGPPYGLVGTHIYADPPLFVGPGDEAASEPAQLLITSDNLPAVSPWMLAVMALLVGMAGVYAVIRSRPSPVEGMPS